MTVVRLSHSIGLVENLGVLEAIEQFQAPVLTRVVVSVSELLPKISKYFVILLVKSDVRACEIFRNAVNMGRFRDYTSPAAQAPRQSNLGWCGIMVVSDPLDSFVVQ